MQRINVRIDDQLKSRLEAEAREKGVRPSDVVRQVLEEHLKAREPEISARALAERLGLLGAVPGLPADLSTDPAHMDGFGG